MTISMYLWMLAKRVRVRTLLGFGYPEQNLLPVTKQLQDGDACIPSLYNGVRQLRQAMGERHL
jgi:hypothetical protein